MEKRAEILIWLGVVGITAFSASLFSWLMFVTPYEVIEVGNTFDVRYRPYYNYCIASFVVAILLSMIGLVRGLMLRKRNIKR